MNFIRKNLIFFFLSLLCSSLAMALDNDIEVNKTYALKSRSCGGWLDGRGSDDKEVLVANKIRKPINDTYLQWNIMKIDGKYVLQSVSSKRYLDGRAHDGQTVLVTDRKAVDDKYLQWEIEKMPSGHHALKSISSKCYLNGRDCIWEEQYPVKSYCKGEIVLVTDRKAVDDKYLQWEIIKLPIGLTRVLDDEESPLISTIRYSGTTTEEDPPITGARKAAKVISEVGEAIVAVVKVIVDVVVEVAKAVGRVIRAVFTCS